MAPSALQTARGYSPDQAAILLLVLFTGLPVMGMAAGGWPAPWFIAATLLGIALAAAAANTFNCYIERDRDALMERTRTRPLPAHEISPAPALAFGLALAIVSTLLLQVVAGPLAARSASRASCSTCSCTRCGSSRARRGTR
jgi:protoheme IX farnesyltransferase